MHEQAYDWIRIHAPRLTATVSGGSVLEIGSHDVNGNVRGLFGAAATYHGIDIAPGPGVDEVADAADWQPTHEFDVVVTTEVLEHAPRWRDILSMALHCLRPGGTLLMTCATDPRASHSAIDGLEVRPGEHYANISPDDLIAWLDESGCTDWEVEVHGDRGDLYLRARPPAP